MATYVNEYENWTDFTWDKEVLEEPLLKVKNLQGRVLGKMKALGFSLQNESNLTTFTVDVLKTSEIEGEMLNPEQVRSSVARHLGLEISGLVPSDRNVDGVVEMMLDATQNFEKPLTKERLFDWHKCLFPTGNSGMYKILVGQWRDDSTGPMQVISGAMGKEKKHFQAPDASRLEAEMDLFINWFNKDSKLDLVMKSAIAHFWFVTIHPFDDGNGRIARSLTDLLLSRADGSKQRFYSMSAQVSVERKKYYETLEQSQKDTRDITLWLSWFLNCLYNALVASEQTLAKVMFKHHFWNKNAQTLLNERQKLMLNKLLDEFEGKLTSSKWAKICKCSQDSALRDLQDLIQKNVLQKELAGGRSTNYELIKI